MKCILILFTVFTMSIRAQTILTFNKPFIESEDKWVAFQKDKDSTYAQIQSGQLDKDAESCKKAITVYKDKTYNGENCYNLLHNYYLKKDKANFTLWLNETKKWTSASTSITSSIKIMEAEMAK
jgi:lipopolysaccharide biosynthesis regulator YciM